MIKGKEEFGGGWLCWRKKNGCGAKFPDGDQRIEGQEVGEIENPDLPDNGTRSTRWQKARLRRRSAVGHRRLGDLHPRRRGGPHRDRGGRLEYGPVVSGELKQAATRPRSSCAAAKSTRPRRCGKPPGRVRRLHARGRREERSCSPPRRRPCQRAGRRGRHTDEPSQRQRVITQQPTQAQEGTERTQPAATEPPAEPPSQPANPQAPNGEAPGPNPHGARLRQTAAARGVSDGELANLIRNAVAQGPIPAERARTALPEMLARITEEISERTVELVEMFYPPAGPSSKAGSGEATSVDFGALEPPQAA